MGTFERAVRTTSNSSPAEALTFLKISNKFCDDIILSQRAVLSDVFYKLFLNVSEKRLKGQFNSELRDIN